jgi:hypothetical protein
VTQKFLGDINCSLAVRSDSDVHMWLRLAYCYRSNTKIRVVPCLVVIDCCMGCTFVEESYFNTSQKLFLNRSMLSNLSNFRVLYQLCNLHSALRFIVLCECEYRTLLCFNIH